LSEKDRQQAWADVMARLRKEPYTFEFFQAIRLLEHWRGTRVGHFQDPAREPVRFVAHQSLGFPASDIQEVAWDQQPPTATVNFMGLTGPSGVLPHVYTELIQERGYGRKPDNSLRDFLDIFNHRLISLFYRAWKKTHFAAQVDTGEGDAVPGYLRSVVGLQTAGLRDRTAVEDEAFLYYAGLLAAQPRSAVALEQLLADYFGVRVEIEQFVGRWRSLDADSVCTFDDLESPSEMLGGGAVVGDEVWDQQSTIRVCLGPLSREEYERFLPGQRGFVRLRDLTTFFARGHFDFEVQLILRRDDAPGVVVGGEGADRVQLGWTTWVRSRTPLGRDPGDAVLPLSD
jgi:type VI secretion system protein ImpH